MMSHWISTMLLIFIVQWLAQFFSTQLESKFMFQAHSILATDTVNVLELQLQIATPEVKNTFDLIYKH